MKRIEISLWEITKEEVLKLPSSTQIMIYNTITCTYRVEWADDKNGIARSKYASEFLRYFSFEDPHPEGSQNEK